MSVYRQGSLERVRTFAYAQVSSFLERHAINDTVKSLSESSGLNYSMLIGIKNMRIRGISLQRLTDVMDKLGMDYQVTFGNKNGIQFVKMEIDRASYSPTTERILKRESVDQMIEQRHGK